MMKLFGRNHPSYGRQDVRIAIGLFLFYMILLYVFGRYQSLFFELTILGYSFRPTSWMVWCLLVLILVLRKQKPSSIGLTTHRFKASSLLGLMVGGVWLVIALVTARVNRQTFAGTDYLVFGLVYYLFEIGLTEELLFRGFIQTRLAGYFRHWLFATIVAGMMFASIHIPFQMSVLQLGLIDFIRFRGSHLMLTFLYHFVFAILYRAYDNIAAPTILHLLMNLSFSLFV
jgi:uncharacterized protein